MRPLFLLYCRLRPPSHVSSDGYQRRLKKSRTVAKNHSQAHSKDLRQEEAQAIRRRAAAAPGNTNPGHARESPPARPRECGDSSSPSGSGIMSVRTTSRTVTFRGPFILSGIGGIQPAGCYTVETDEELVPELSSSTRRQIATLILLPAQFGGAALAQIARIDPLELEVALERDAMKGCPDGR